MFALPTVGRLALIAVSLALIVFGVWKTAVEVYQVGFAAGETKERVLWQKWYAEETTKANARAEEIERSARAEQQQAAQRSEQAAEQIDKLRQEIAKNKTKYNTVYNRQAAVVCQQPDGVYLGLDFSNRWNEINAEGR